MSHLLQFSENQLPRDLRPIPYAAFGINDTAALTDMRPDIPLDIILHYIPGLKQWVNPSPSTCFLPLPLTQLALRKPYVGINIKSADVDETGLKCIIDRAIQLSGATFSRDVFPVQYSLETCTSIHKAWLALDLPLAGIVNLHLYMQTHLELGGPVAFPEISAIWETFGPKSEITRAMGMNFIRHYMSRDYTTSEFAEIHMWYHESAARHRFFIDLEDTIPRELQVKQWFLNIVSEADEGQEYWVENTSREQSTLKAAKSKKRTKARLKSTSPGPGETNSDRTTRRRRSSRRKSNASTSSVETAIYTPTSDFILFPSPPRSRLSQRDRGRDRNPLPTSNSTHQPLTTLPPATSLLLHPPTRNKDNAEIWKDAIAAQVVHGTRRTNAGMSTEVSYDDDDDDEYEDGSGGDDDVE